MQYVSTVFEIVKAGLPLAVLAVVAYVVYYAVKNGVPAAYTLVKGWFTKTAADLKALESRVSAVETHLGLKSAGSPSGTTGPAK